MFSYVFMKILEGRPRSYDRAMHRASGGRILGIKQAVAERVSSGARVLEIGCGTGELAALMIARGATVLGFDASAGMVRAAEERVAGQGLEGSFQVRHMGVDAMDSLEEGAFDAVVSTLVFSELSGDERRFALRHAHRVLGPGGLLVIADEVVPRSAGRRALHALGRAPLVAVTYLVSHAMTRPVEELAGEIRSAGFSVETEERSHGDAFALVVARKEGEAA